MLLKMSRKELRKDASDKSSKFCVKVNYGNYKGNIFAAICIKARGHGFESHTDDVATL